MEINSTWQEYCDKIDMKIKSGDLCNFLQWEPIRQTMFHFCNPIEFETLKNKGWDKWQIGIKEDNFGNPSKYKDYPESSPNLIHHAYSLSKIRPDGNIDDINSIFEFGGGYGSFCRLIYKLGFTGKYTIYDLPVLLKLQQLYLDNIGLAKNNIHLTNIEDKQKVDLFVALWSLSESPLSLREKIIDRVKFKECLIVYQDAWLDIDNKEYFNKLQEDMPNYTWKTEHISHIPNSYYLIGKEKNESI